MDDTLPLIYRSKKQIDPIMSIMGLTVSLVSILMSIFILIITYIEKNEKNSDHQQTLNVIVSNMCIIISLIQMIVLRKPIKSLCILMLVMYIIYGGFIGVGICILYPYSKADQSLLYTSSFIYFTLCWSLPVLFISIVIFAGMCHG